MRGVNMKVLVTGGAGYIGSHTCLELLRADHEVLVIDDLSNGNMQALDAVQRLSNRSILFRRCDIREQALIDQVFSDFEPEVVVHFAGLKSVSESVVEPLKYYDVNLGGTAIILSAMEKSGCENIVFSSSATVYGEPSYMPCDEDHPLSPINPYGRSKHMCEQLLRDWSLAKEERKVVALRYFNPVGAHPTGLIGEDPSGTPNNLMPLVLQVASGKRTHLQVFGSNYDTLDGTGVRDYVHVVDLAKAHVVAVEKISSLLSFEAFNIGTGQGTSVLQLVHEFERQSEKTVNYEFAPVRNGDVPAIWADVERAAVKLGFKTQFNLADMCRDTWQWRINNPNGYTR